MTQLEGYKVVRAEEMARVERASIEAGASGEAYMLKAGEGIASRVEQFIKQKDLERRVTLLVGKGNNGGDAFVAGTLLLGKGFVVEAYQGVSLEEASPLCQKQGKLFAEAGGVISSELELKGVILDGLLGTGFWGKVEGKLAEVIEKVNGAELPVLAIDIPSGVDGNTGAVESVAIQAKETFFLGMPKLGFFMGEGYNYVGRLRGIDFGLEAEYLHEARAAAHLVNESALHELLPPLKRTRHKYEAGYVIAIAGSPGMPGAAMLASLAALKGGAGIVRLFHPEGMEEELAPAAYELIRAPYRWDDPSEILEEAKRAKACLVGPGVGRSEEMGTFLRENVKRLYIPIVIDADALYHLKEFPKGAILTPHKKEMAHLLGGEEVNRESCQAFAEREGVTVVLKGAPTWIFHPGTLPLIIPRGDPGMATAGTGDVLTGMIAAFLAQGVLGREGAALGVYLHALCGEEAAKKLTSYCVVASDLMDTLPEILQKPFGEVEDADC
ncbi:NAD(P)H-hydrate dehydratase [Candidatus Neptunochlamydia vexilliferae]|uniref:NAD(P)H-hydrate dehydratase n=1 Tax=Candidatus Neptunichlamydia vexilliferae TaxID=1651774 RepID=UPI001890BFE9|nr:NAD(P)H-hydrate dehydratase [Candidatus Neptunochlamydia vexilliferae]